jgi:hypothetical protein
MHRHGTRKNQIAASLAGGARQNGPAPRLVWVNQADDVSETQNQGRHDLSGCYQQGFPSHADQLARAGFEARVEEDKDGADLRDGMDGVAGTDPSQSKTGRMPRPPESPPKPLASRYVQTTRRPLSPPQRWRKVPAEAVRGHVASDRRIGQARCLRKNSEPGRRWAQGRAGWEPSRERPTLFLVFPNLRRGTAQTA